MNKLNLDKEILQSLSKARKTYGNKNQILVCMEELNELACVLAKYPRYTDENRATEELHDKVLDEIADVMIILNHVQSIFGLSSEEIDDRIYAKVNRMKRWLLHSDSMQETVDDRSVEFVNKCSSCVHRSISNERDYMEYCQKCYQAQATEGVSPFYRGE